MFFEIGLDKPALSVGPCSHLIPGHFWPFSGRGVEACSSGDGMRGVSGPLSPLSLFDLCLLVLECLLDVFNVLSSSCVTIFISHFLEDFHQL